MTTPSDMRRCIHALVILMSMQITARAQSAGSAVTSPCVVTTPLVTVAEGPLSVGAGATVQYVVTVTNRDEPGCPATTFDVRGKVEEGWEIDMQPARLNIPPGSIGRAMLSVTSPSTAAARTFFVWANVSDGTTVVHNGSAAAAYTIISGCVLMSPAMAVTPVMTSGAPGATFVYDVTVTNHDAAACPPTTFAVLPDLADDWKRVISPSSLILKAGQSQTVRVAVTSPPGVAPAAYSLYARATDGRNVRHVASAELSYTVTAVAAPPRPPSSLTATARPEMKRIQLRWTGSDGDAGYRIMRNGVAAGVASSTTWTDVAWRSGEAVTYYVVATDFAGRASAPSNTAVVRLSPGK